MLVIRLQRTGRKGHAMFRIVVQDSRRSPSSGKVVALLGNYDPHSKNISLDKDKTTHYLTHGAQPSDRVISILKSESIKLPKWVTSSPVKQKAVRNPEKRRSAAPEKSAEGAKETSTEASEDQQEHTESSETEDQRESTEKTDNQTATETDSPKETEDNQPAENEPKEDTAEAASKEQTTEDS